MKASVAIQVLPGVTDKDEICRIVDECIAYIKAQGLKTFVALFETTIEGELDQLIEIVKQCQYIAIKSGAILNQTEYEGVVFPLAMKDEYRYPEEASIMSTARINTKSETELSVMKR